MILKQNVFHIYPGTLAEMTKIYSRSYDKDQTQRMSYVSIVTDE